MVPKLSLQALSTMCLRFLAGSSCDALVIFVLYDQVIKKGSSRALFARSMSWSRWTLFENASTVIE